jgi:hypothetical protein
VAAGATVEYYLVAESTGAGPAYRYMRFEWEGPDPSFVMLAPLHEALDELGAFTADAEAVWPGSPGEPYFYVEPGSVDPLQAVFASTEWQDFLTAGRIRDALGVSDMHAAEMLDLAVREAERLTELLRAAQLEGCGLLAIVY